MRDAASIARETGAQLIALHVIDERVERDMLLSSNVSVDVWRFPLDGLAAIPLDLVLRERALDLSNFVEREAEPLSQDRVKKVVRLGKFTRENNQLHAR